MAPWPGPDGKLAGRFLVVAESGLAMLEATGKKGQVLTGDAATIVGGIRSVFSIPMAPIVGWAVADVNGDGADEIIAANRYGAIVILDGSGKTLAATVAAAELRDIAVLPTPGGGCAILAAANTGLLKLDSQLNLIAAAPDAVDCRKVETLMEKGAPKAVCLFASGHTLIVAE